MPSLSTLLILTTAAGRVAAQGPIASGRVASGTLAFDGRATMGNFTGTTTTLTGAMTGGPELASVRGWVETPVATLKTGKDKRDRDLRKAMESDKYPAIRYELTGVTVGGWTAGSADVTLHGRFLIHGVERNVELSGLIVVDHDQVRLQATTPLDLKDYRIDRLSKMLGVLKMHEDIVVHVDVTFALDTGADPGTPRSESAASAY